MAKRKGRYNWLDDAATREHWLIERDMVGLEVKERKLAAGTDLVWVYLEELSRWKAEGWSIESFRSDNPSFFVTKEGERRHVCIAPAQPQSGARSDN